MAEATDQQMQTFANERVRPRAEQARALFNALRDDKAALTDVYDRADGGAAWNDNRTDGPPKLLASQDMLVYNTIVVQLLNILEGTESGTEAQINAQRAAYIGDLRANWPVFQQACVRPPQG